MTKSKKLFTWGNNDNGQLGHKPIAKAENAPEEEEKKEEGKNEEEEKVDTKAQEDKKEEEKKEANPFEKPTQVKFFDKSNPVFHMSLCKRFTLVITSPSGERRKLFAMGENVKDKNREKDKHIVHLKSYDRYDPYRAYVIRNDQLVVFCGYTKGHNVTCETCKASQIETPIYIYRKQGEMKVACLSCYKKKKVTLPPVSFYLKYPVREMEKLMNNLKDKIPDRPNYMDIDSNKTDIFPSDGSYTCYVTGSKTFKNVAYMLCNQ